MIECLESLHYLSYQQDASLLTTDTVSTFGCDYRREIILQLYAPTGFQYFSFLLFL